MSTALPPSPGQTIGPFFGYALPYAGGSELVPPGAPGAIRLFGRVLDGAGAGVPDALLEIWQAGPSGAVIQQAGSLRRDGWTFTGWGRAETDSDGGYSFSTLRPGPPGPGKATFIGMTIFARGLLNRLFTRVYLPGDPAALTADPLLAALPPDRRATLLAAATPDGYQFDVVLQAAGTPAAGAPGETVFLSYPGHRLR